MMSNNKILTVSYGTFSCTLEGFDDSFGTMKAIAEYFRDLASEDRYFGAEPPQPDAEMLARIAEKEIARRVEGHLENGGVVLRAGAAGPTALAAAGVAAAGADLAEDDTPVAQPQSEDIAAVETVAEEPAAELDASVEETAAEPVEAVEEIAETPVEDTVAEAVSEVEDAAPEVEMTAEPDADAEVAETAEDTVVEQTEDDTDSLIAAFAADAEQDDATAATEEEPLVLDTPVAPETTYDEDAAESFFANSSDDEDDAFYEDTASESSADINGTSVAEVVPQANSIAAKLQRIRDVVSRNTAEATGPYSEDEHAEELRDEEEDEDHTNDIAESSSAAYANMGWGVELNQHDEDDDYEDTADSSEDDELTALLRDSVAAQDTVEESHDAGDTLAEDDSADLEDEDDGENLFSEADEPVVPTPPVARVVRVKRADVQAEAEPEDVAEDTSALSAEDEADLMRELAEVEAEADVDAATDASLDDDFSSISDEEFEAELSQEAEAAAEQDAATAAHRLQSASGTEDEALDRLMAEAEQQLDEPEGTSRRAAFSHLRAAVAAKIADAGLGKKDEAETTEAYRNDLADAVKPRRPIAKDTRSERPAMRPAPLKLVAEQRIDGDTANDTPVRPRRVATGLDITDSSDFAEYASDRGASELPELLEAAASYLSFVEGLDQFSRPQLMTKVRQVEKENFSREDGLRSFGQLLREGKIEKIKGGRFTVSEDIGYRPDGERAAG